MLEARRRRLPGVDLRPGAVKQARQEAGLSLADVAGTRVTRAAIHLIESGRSRPSLPVLEMIAEKTGRPVSWFLADAAAGRSDLELEAELSELEALAEGQDYEELLPRAEAMLERRLPEIAEARARYFAGRALVRVHRASEALPHLRRALAIFEAAGDQWMVVECMDWIAGALYTEDDPSAITLQEEALVRCRRLDPVPVRTEIRILTNLAQIRVRRHEWSKAAKLFEQVIERGADLQDVGRLARVYVGLGIAYRQLGDMVRAVTYTQKGVAYHSLQHDMAALSVAERTLGELLIRHGDLATAEAHLARALKNAESNGLEQERRRVLLSFAELQLGRGELDLAERSAREAAAASSDDRRLTGGAHSLLGRIKAAAGDRAESDAHFASAIRVFEELQETEQLVEVHHAYAQALKDRGDVTRALDELEAAVLASHPGLVPMSTPAERQAGATA
jgi:tetratricopeptide (TPR) repeat protein